MLKSYLFKFLAIFAVCMTVSFGLSAQWDATITVNSGAATGDYNARQAGFGPGITDAITAPLSYVVDTSGATTACFMTEMDLTGTIALIDRGGCGFLGKAQVAEAANAMAVIVCNSNSVVPAQTIVMGVGPNDDPNSVTIPVVMTSFEECQTIRMGDPASTITLSAGNDYVYGPEESCANALEIAPGTYTIDTIVGGGTGFAGSGNARWYTYTPTTNITATLSNCGDPVDSRFYVITDCDLSAAFIVTNNDDCDGANNVFSSEASWIAEAGFTYYIVWDDRWSDQGFDFTLSESALPAVNISATVDMRDETVDPAGVFLGHAPMSADGAEDITIVAAVDNGDGTWTASIEASTLDSLNYVFVNGTPDVVAFSNAESVPSDCGLATIFGFNARPFIVNTTQDVILATVCFSSCEACPPDVSCPVWIDENFDAYTLGGISAQSPIWTQWTAGSAGEDAAVTDAFAASGANAMEISTADPDDQLLLLGNRTEGNYILKWNMYVPTGSGAYYNLQKDEVPNTEFGAEVVFNVDGTATYSLGDGFSYPHDTWFVAYHAYDLDNNLATVYIDGEFVAQHPIGADGGLNQLGSIDFFGLPSASALYYIDDVILKEIDPCPANAIICDGADGYSIGLLGPQAPHWTPWSLTDGAADDAVVVNNEFLSCEQSIVVSEANGTDLLLQLGDKTEGNYGLSWSFYIPAGATGYFNTQKIEATPGGEFGMQAFLNADGTGTLDVGAVGAMTFNYPQDTWFAVYMGFDIDNNIASLTVDGVDVMTWPADGLATTAGAGLKQIGGLNFFGNSGTEQYIDNLVFVQLPSLVGDVCASANDVSGLFGQGLNNVQTSSIYDNTGYTNNGDPADGFECFGEPDGLAGMPTLENTIWFTFVGDGESYFITTVNCDGVTDYINDGDTQIAIYSGDCTAPVGVACNEDDPNRPANEFPAGLQFDTEAGVTYYMMIDGFDATAIGGGFSDGEFCISVDQLTAPTPVTMTVSVDMSVVGASADGVFISGSFNEWTAPGNSVPLTDNGDGTWSVTIDIPANETTQYKFQNGITDASWEDIDLSEGEGCTLTDFGNRFVVATDQNVVQDEVCFNYCVTCIEVSVIDAKFAAAISVFPNPTSDNTNIQYNFEDASDLTIRLTNTLGQTVKTALIKNALQGTHTLNVSDLAAGMYMLHITDGERAATQSLVID